MFKCCTIISVLALSFIWGNPNGPSSNANFTVSGVGTNNLVVTVSGGNTTITWQDFSIKPSETVTFNGSGTSTTFNVLNKVVNGATQIDGALFATNKSNINIYIVNPNGITIGPGGTVVTSGSFVASSLPLVSSFNPNDPGGMHFTGTNTGTFVRNDGHVTSLNADVVFMGYRVIQGATGVISAANTAALGAGMDLLFKSTDAQRIYIQTSQPAGNSGVGIDFGGSITAMSTVMIADCNPYALAINFTGAVHATGCSSAEGRVKLISTCPNVPCTTNGIIQITGIIDRASTTGQGSEIDIIGSTILILPGAVLNVQGMNGGGIVNIGTSANCPTSHVCIDRTAQILANALLSGNGGTVNVYAANSLLFIGTIDVRGAGTTPGNGNGGTVTLTSPGYLGIDGMVNLSATGTGLPGSLTATTSAINVGGAPNYGSGCLSGIDGCLCISNMPGSIFTQVSLQNILNTGNVGIIANGAYVSGVLNVVTNISWVPCNSLVLFATDEINILGLIQQTGVGPSTGTGVALAAPIINIGLAEQNQSFFAGVDINCGNITVSSPIELNLFGGLGNGSFARLAANHGSVSIVFADFGQILVLAGNGAGAYAGILGGTLVDIQSIVPCKGLVNIAASACSIAFIDSPVVNVGTHSSINELAIFGGTVGSGNIAYVGSITQGSNINMVLCGDLGVIGGASGSGNTASIVSTNGFNTTTSIVADDIVVAGGVGGVNNSASIISTGDLTSITIRANQDMFISGGTAGTTSTSATVQADTVTITTKRDLFVTGGQGVLDVGSIYGINGVNLTIGRNLGLLGGEATAAFGEIVADFGNIVIDSSTSVSSFSFRASDVGLDNAPARLYITGDGSVLIGQIREPSYIEFVGGSSGSSPTAEVIIDGSGNILITSKNDITLLGGGAGLETQAEFTIGGTGQATILAKRDLILTTGTTTTSNVGIRPNNGQILISSVRDTLLTGSCEVPNIAFFRAGGPNGLVTIRTGRDLLRRDITFIGADNGSAPVLEVGRFNTVLDCHGIPPCPPVPPVPPCHCPSNPCLPFIPFPGYQYFKYTFLYEIFYRLHNIRAIDFYQIHDRVWDTITYTSP